MVTGAIAKVEAPVAVITSLPYVSVDDTWDVICEGSTVRTSDFVDPAYQTKGSRDQRYKRGAVTGSMSINDLVKVH